MIFNVFAKISMPGKTMSSIKYSMDNIIISATMRNKRYFDFFILLFPETYFADARRAKVFIYFLCDFRNHIRQI